MQDIAKIDSNFNVETKIDKEDLKFYDAESKPFRIYGLLREEEGLCRIPRDVAEKVSPGVLALHGHTAGGRIRFVTDSPYVAISAEMKNIGKMCHFALTGSAGFDLYIDEGEGQRYHGTFRPPFDIETGYESVLDFPDRKKRVITIDFPLYSDVKKLYIGLHEQALLDQAPDYRYEGRVVYYGSSITQGGCASRPGNSYQAIISRLLDWDYTNLGFSGNAKGEDAITDYISSLDMQCFVMDYDHNAPSVEHLENTHERMFKRIRERQPELPIVMVTRPKAHLTDVDMLRLAVVERTYQNAVDAGDENVYFVRGCDLIAPELAEVATVDGVHPNDSGFVSMAYGLCKVLKGIYEKMEHCN